MTEEVFRLVFDKVEHLKSIDRNLHEIEWEAIGGETTMMPFDWWNRQLPWSLERIEGINKGLRSPGSMNFLTNLIYTDARYTDLFNEYGHHPAFCLYTSWEPDTERFGKRNQLFDRFYKTLCSIDAREKILDIILTKEIIKIGAERVLEMFVPAGITDFSMKMISAYGSGKAFFDPNMEEFHLMSEFFKDMHRLKPSHVTFTPQEEMLSSLVRETSFQCNGNFKYDLSIEPDGVCHFNANQTADEAALGFRTIVIDDPNWHYKICFENKVEENNKLSLLHPECDQCEYLTHCNAGWYHYKVADPVVIDRYRGQDCSGYRQFWDFNKELVSTQLSDRGRHVHQQQVRQSLIARKEADTQQVMAYPAESSIAQRYKPFFELVKEADSLTLDRETVFAKSLMERLWFYDDLAIATRITDDVLRATPNIDTLMDHALSNNLPSLTLSDEQINWYLSSSTRSLAQRCRDFLAMLGHHVNGAPIADHAASDLIVDDRHDEMFRSLIAFSRRQPQWIQRGMALTPSAAEYLSRLLEFMSTENRLSGDAA